MSEDLQQPIPSSAQALQFWGRWSVDVFALLVAFGFACPFLFGDWGSLLASWLPSFHPVFVLWLGAVIFTGQGVVHLPIRLIRLLWNHAAQPRIIATAVLFVAYLSLLCAIIFATLPALREIVFFTREVV